MNSESIISLSTKRNKQGYIQIKPRSLIKEVNEFGNVQLWNATKHDEKFTGPVFFKNVTWVSYENTERNLKFLPKKYQTTEINLQIKLYALINHYIGKFDGGAVLKLSTLQNHIAALKKFGSFIINNGYNSFHELNNKPDLILRSLFHSYLTNHLKISLRRPWRTLDDIFTPTNSFGLFSPNVCEIFLSTKAQLLSIFHPVESKVNSHPVIPIVIHKRIISFAEEVISNCNYHIESWEKENNYLLSKIKNKDFPSNYLKTPKTVNKIILACLPEKSRKYKILKEKTAFFYDLKLAVYIYLLSFSGMRFNEALSCKFDCAKFFNGNYELWAETTKTDKSKVLASWIINKETFEAIKLLERFSGGMLSRAEVLLHNAGSFIKSNQVHNLNVGLAEKRIFSVVTSTSGISFAQSGRFTDFEIKSDTYRHLFDLTLTNNCINHLEELGCNYSAIKGKTKGVPYLSGNKLNLSAHMFRHTFAYFIVANKLGHHGDISAQFKHLNSAMTRVYADRGLLAKEEVVNLVEGFESLLIKQVANEIADQAQNKTLGGGAGKQLNKSAENLVIGVTNSNNSKSPYTKQIHFKDINEFKAFLVKNIDMIRGLPHGYCTAGEACKIKGAAVPSGCVACGSFIITERHKKHWLAMKNDAESKLARYELLTPSQQSEFELFKLSWLKNIKAANQAIGNLPKIERNSI